MQPKIHHHWYKNKCVVCGIKRMTEHIKVENKSGFGNPFKTIQSTYYVVKGEKITIRPNCIEKYYPTTHLNYIAQMDINEFKDIHKDDTKKTIEPFPYDESSIVKMNHYQLELVNSMSGGEDITQDKKSKILKEIGEIEKFLKKLGDQWIQEILLFNPTIKRH